VRFQALTLLVTLCYFGSGTVIGQSGINGQVQLDTTWEPKAYLSEIPDFSDMTNMSYNQIISEVNISKRGDFKFLPSDLSGKDKLYRIHFVKKNYPVASLIIGGKDQNHFFIIANNTSSIEVKAIGGSSILGNLQISGYTPNRGLYEIHRIVSLLDTVEYLGSDFTRDFIREAVNSQLISYADTCSHKLVAQYALFKSGAEKESKSIGWRIIQIIAIAIGLLIGILLLTRKLIPKNKNPLAKLTIQERKIYALLKEGKSNKEIAEECSISISTVKSHVNNVYSKLGVSSRREVVDI